MAKKKIEPTKEAPGNAGVQPSPPAPQPQLCQIVMAQDAALGAGTREKGTVMAFADYQGAQTFDPDSIEPAEGIAQIEIEALMLNPQLIEVNPI